MSAPQPGRRAVLAAGLLLPLAACTGSDPRPAPAARATPSTPPPPPDPDVARRSAAVARERGLLALYDGALGDPALPPARSAALTTLRAEHAAHLAALGSPEGVPTAGPPPSAAAAPAGAAQLVAAEQAASSAHAADALVAGRLLAAVLASLAASEASHPVALA